MGNVNVAGGGPLAINGVTEFTAKLTSAVSKNDSVSLRLNGMTKLADPATLPTGIGWGVAFSPNGDYLAVAHPTTPFITIYKRSGDTFTKLANPATLPTYTGYAVAWDPTGTYLAWGGGRTPSPNPCLIIYKRSGDTFTALGGITAPWPNIDDLTFSADGVYLMATNNSSPYVHFYKRSGDVFTKLSNPTTLPPDSGYSLDISSDGVYFGLAHYSSPNITVYKRSGDTFSKIANPATLPGQSFSLRFNKDATVVVVGRSEGVQVEILSRSGDTLTNLVKSPTPISTGGVYGTRFSPDDNILAVPIVGSPFIQIYKRHGTDFIRMDSPATLPTGAAYEVAISNDGKYLAVAHYASPYVTIYKLDWVADKDSEGNNNYEMAGYVDSAGALNELKTIKITHSRNG